MRTIVSKKEENASRAAEQVICLLREKPNAVIALSAGEDSLRLYERLAHACAQGEISLAQTRFFSVTEFAGLDTADERSCHSRLRAALKETDVNEENVVYLSEKELERYDERLAAAGGLDLAVLDLGVNARIGFNEPATPFDSLSHRQKLAPASRRELAELFGAEDAVPEFGLTMGIHTLVRAKEILVIASGGEKAKAVFDMLYGRDDSVVPAAFLQIPTEVTVYLDEDAAAKL